MQPAGFPQFVAGRLSDDARRAASRNAGVGKSHSDDLLLEAATVLTREPSDDLRLIADHQMPDQDFGRMPELPSFLAGVWMVDGSRPEITTELAEAFAETGSEAAAIHERANERAPRFVAEQRDSASHVQ
jgi:hypothetical protein